MELEVQFAEAEDLLRGAEFEDCRSLWYSSNYVYLATLTCPGGQQLAAIYKPLRGESPLWDFPEGNLYKHEAAAYELANLLGWPFVPPTIVRDGPQGIGSVQLFVQHDQTSSFFEQRENADLVPQLQRMAVFDFVANNADRKGGHCLLDEHGRVWGIDHGLCFHPQYKMRTVMWDWSEQPIPDAWLAELERGGELIAGESESALRLTALLGRDEAGALLGRIDLALRERVFPKPGPHRSYPWPLV